MSFEIGVDDLPALALGSSVLGCGGGGNPYYGQLVAREVLAKSGPVSVIDLNEMQSDSLAILSVLMGAPLVGIEKPVSLTSLISGFRAIERSVKTPIAAFVAAEVGGAQSVLPLLLSALTGRPTLDGDGMGRAFPEAQMCTFLIHGVYPGVPMALSDDHGLLFSLPQWIAASRRSGRFGGTSRAGRWFGLVFERGFRRYCAYKGGLIQISASLDCASLEASLVRGSFRLALEIGRAVEAARAGGGDPVAAISSVAGGRRLLCGKIADVERRFRGGHDWGMLRIEGLDEDRGRSAEVSFKNEFLVLRVEGEVILTVPDLIAVVERETGAPVTTEVLRPGLRIAVLGLPCSSLYCAPEALRVVEPRAFGYDLPFVRLADERG